jgi:hypothetical protein
MNFVDQLVDSFAELGRDIGEFVPRLIVALLLLLVGHWIAKLIRRILTSVLERVGAGRLTEAAGLEPMLQQAGTSGVRLLGQIAYFLIFLIFIQIAAEVLGIQQLTELLSDLISYLPLVLVALLVLFVAAAIANWASGVVRPFAESRNMGWVATAVRIGVLIGLMVFRMPFGIIMTGVGVISLAGIVVNNAIILVDYIDLLRRRDGLGEHLDEAPDLAHQQGLPVEVVCKDFLAWKLGRPTTARFSPTSGKQTGKQ